MGTILYTVKFGEGLMGISGREFLYEMFGNLINIQYKRTPYRGATDVVYKRPEMYYDQICSILIVLFYIYGQSTK